MCLACLTLKAVFLIREVVIDAVMATRASSTMFHAFRVSKLISPITKTRRSKDAVVLEMLNRQDESIDVQEKES